jgi:hypothetical protein
MTVNSRVIKTFLMWSPDAVDVPLMNGLRVQILPTIDDLPRARKHQFAAFIASEGILVVWDDEALHLVQRAKSIESELMELVWKAAEADEEEDSIKKAPRGNTAEIDEETGKLGMENRATHLMNSVLVMFTLILILVSLGAGCREIVIEISVDHNIARLAFFALVPIQVFFSLVRTFVLSALMLVLTKPTVLRASHSWLHGPMYRPCPSDATKLEVLLCHPATSSSELRAPSYHDPMSRVQGRSGVSHCTHGQVHQAGYLDI